MPTLCAIHSAYMTCPNHQSTTRMDKTLVILLSTFSFFLISSRTVLLKNDDLEDLAKWELIGPVKYVEEKFYAPIESSSGLDSLLLNVEEDFRFLGKQQLFFNEKGLLEEHKYLQPDYLSWHVFYNDLGLIRKGTNYNPQKQLKEFLEISYDEQGNPKQQTWFKSDSTIARKRTFTYNASQQQIEVVSGSKRITKFTFGYDSAGREIERKTYFNEIFSSRRAKTYDSQGQLSTRLAEKPDGTLLWQETYTYHNGKLSKKVVTNYTKESNRVFGYNAMGHWVEIKEWKLGDNTNLVNQANSLYQYDEQGNWTQRISYENGRVKELKTREIEYR